LVHSSNSTTWRGTDYGGMQDNKLKGVKSSKKVGKRNVSVVPSHFIKTDVSDVKGETLIFSNMMFCIPWLKKIYSPLFPSYHHHHHHKPLIPLGKVGNIILALLLSLFMAM